MCNTPHTMHTDRNLWTSICCHAGIMRACQTSICEQHVDGTSTISIAAAVCTVVLLVLMMGTVMAPSQIDRAPTSMEIEENSKSQCVMPVIEYH